MHRRCSNRSPARGTCQIDTSQAAPAGTCGARRQLPTRPGAMDLVALPWWGSRDTCQFGLPARLAWRPHATEAAGDRSVRLTTPTGLGGRYGQKLLAKFAIQSPLAVAVAGCLLLSSHRAGCISAACACGNCLG